MGGSIHSALHPCTPTGVPRIKGTMTGGGVERRHLTERWEARERGGSVLTSHQAHLLKVSPPLSIITLKTKKLPMHGLWGTHLDPIQTMAHGWLALPPAVTTLLKDCVLGVPLCVTVGVGSGTSQWGLASSPELPWEGLTFSAG